MMCEKKDLNFDIQSACLHDLPSMLALWRERMLIIRQSIPHLHRYIQAETGYLTQLQRWVSDEQVVVLCAKKRAALIGYIVGVWRDNFPVVMDMVLDAHAYHRGLAKNLFSISRVQLGVTSDCPMIIRVARYYAVEQAFWRGLGAIEWVNHTWKNDPLYQWMLLSSAPLSRLI